jgi:holin-like protein
VKGFVWLMAFWLLGELVVRAVSLPIPGQLVGMVALFVSLRLGWVKLDWIKAAAQLLLSHMMLLFVPVVVGVMLYYRVLAEAWLPVSAAVILGTLIVLLVSGGTVKLLERTRDREAHHRIQDKEAERHDLSV